MSHITVLYGVVDCIYEIAGFLTSVECCKLSMTGKAFKKILESEKIWDYFIQYRISAFNRNFYNNSHLSINFLKDVLGYRRAKDFYLSFRQLEFNIIGWFRALPPFNTDGGLFRGMYVENELLYQLIDATGELDNEKSFKITYDNVAGNLISQSLSAGGATYIVELGNKIIFRSAPSTLPSSIISFEPIPAKEVSAKVMRNSVNREPEFLILEYILGFHISRYNQGCVLEILNISISNQSISTWIQPIKVPAIDFGQLQLHGLKITGDDYVPSGELSFCINLDREVDPQARLLWRNRRIVYYPNVPYGRENFSVEERLDNIAAWYSGYMQVAFPGFQHPSWAPCQFIMYRNPLANGGRFNIIWDNRMDATEFRPLFPGNETEPRVTTTLEIPTTAPTTTAMEPPSLLPWQPQQQDATNNSFSSSLMAAILSPDNNDFIDFLEDNEEQEVDTNDHVVVSRKEIRTLEDISDAEIASIRRMLSCGRSRFSREFPTIESFLEGFVMDSLHLDAVTFEDIRYEVVYSEQGGSLEGVLLRWEQGGPVDVGYMHGDNTDFDDSVPLAVLELLWRF